MSFQYELTQETVRGTDCWVLRDPVEDRTLEVSSEPWTDDDGQEWASKRVTAMCGWRVRWVKDGDRWKAVRVS